MKSIMYHYVRPTPKDLPYFRYLHIDDFRLQLDYFQEHDRVLSKEDFLCCLKDRRPTPDGIILTFDDGLRDHFDYVLPELKQRGLWGIFYISTATYTQRRLLDVHRIHVLLGARGGQALVKDLDKMIEPHMMSEEAIDEFGDLTYQYQNNDEATNQFKRILNYFISYEWRTYLLDRLMALYFPDEASLADDFYMTSSQLKSMHDQGMIIGSHSVSHRVLSKLSLDEQQQEVYASFAFLEDTVGPLANRTFCYPYGGFHTFTTETEQLLDAANCEFSFNVEPRDILVSDLVSRRQALPRFDCNMFPHGKAR